MKNICKYILMGLTCSVLAVSCDISYFKNLNQEPVFDDANAFVAFDKAAVSIDENSEETLRIPVTLASVAGIEETISFKIVEPETKAAKAGVNFEILTTSGVLSFDSYHRTQYIEVKAIPNGEYTGDLKFNIVLNEGATVSTGAAGVCTVTINDIDHPLTAMFGAYKSSGVDLWAGPTSWDIKVEKDTAAVPDVQKIWIYNIANGGGNASVLGMVYGIVNGDMTEIVIPFGQPTRAAYSGVPISFYGLDEETNIYDSGSCTAKIILNEDGSVKGLDFGEEWGFGYLTEDFKAAFAAVLPGITAVKQ